MEEHKLEAILYVEKDIKGETELTRFFCDEAIQNGLRSIAVPEPAGVENIALALELINVPAYQCLMIVRGEEQWQAAKKLEIATLPYQPPEEKVIRDEVENDQAFSSLPKDNDWKMQDWILVEGFDEVDYDFFLKVYQRAKNIPWTIVTTDRLLVRELDLKDLDALYHLYEQPGVTDYMEGLFSYEEERSYQEAYIANMYRYYGYGMWLLWDKLTGQLVGRAGLEHREYGDITELEMGYLITPHRQRQGLATEICKALITYAKDNLDFPRINCLVAEGNKASIGLMEKLAFTYLEDICLDGRKMLRFTLDL